MGTIGESPNQTTEGYIHIFKEMQGAAASHKRP